MKENILKELESEILKKIKYDNISIWPVLRLKFFYEFLEINQGIKSRTRKFNLNNKLIVLKQSFYGFWNLFKLIQVDFLIFSSSERRKFLNNLYYDRVAEGILSRNKDSIIIENPFPLGNHFPISKLPNKRVISESIFFILSIVLGKFSFKKNKFQNLAILENILIEKNIPNFNYERHLKIYLGQYLLMKFILRFVKPKAALFVYSASSMGYIRAFKEREIPVIEMQHGIINKEHNAYNIYSDFGNLFFPDYMFTYGDLEKRVFDSNNYFIEKDKVYPIGYYFLDKCKQSYVPDFEYRNALKEKYRKIIVFSHQEIFEVAALDFIRQIAENDESIVFLIFPRYPEKFALKDNLPANVIIEKKLNIYQGLLIADIHSTVNSTCVMESLFFGVPNLLLNYKGYAMDYYSEILSNENHTIYANSPGEFLDYIKDNKFLDEVEIVKYSETLFKTNFENNLNETINEIINGKI